MQVVYHSDALAGPVQYGLGRYASELARAMRRLDPALVLKPVALRGRRDMLEAAAVAAAGDSVCPGRAGKAYIAAWTVLGVPRIERWAPAAALVHSVELDYPVATRLPWVATVHDLGPLTHPEYFSRSRPALRRRGLDLLLRKAAAVVAVSEATADELRRLVGGRLDDRLHVIPEGVSPDFLTPLVPDVTPVPGLEELQGAPYFLWTGSLNPRKNLGGVLAAFEQLADDVPHHLVLAGGLGWDHGNVLARIERSRARARIHRPGWVTDAQLRCLYAGADGFVYVSLFEGFGLPVLEAMASGAPTITSNLSSMPEVAGEAALLVDPRDPGAIAGAMRRLARDPALRAELTARGRERAREFTWERCARDTLAIYREAAR